MSLERAEARNKKSAATDDAPACHACASYRVRIIEGPEWAHAIPCQACSSSCDQCENTGFMFFRNAHGSMDSMPCPRCEPIRQRIQRYNDAHIPRRYAALQFNDFQYRHNPSLEHAVTKVRSLLNTFSPGDRGIGLSGDVGAGKTMLMALFLRSVTLHHGFSAQFIEFSHLLSDIRAGYDQGRSDAEILGKLVSVPILVIDEMGKALKTEWQIAILDTLISRRYNASVSTFFTTNFPFERDERKSNFSAADDYKVSTLQERIGSRMYSRLREMCEFYTIDAGDFREHKTHDRRR